MKFRLIAPIVLAAALLAPAGAARASSSGTELYPESPLDPTRARVGCNDGTGCHGLSADQPLPTTRLFILGLPAGCGASTPDACAGGAEGGYAPGHRYDLQILVIGLSVPSGVGLVSPGAGFDLEISAGQLESTDPNLRVVEQTECYWLRRQVPACLLGSCQIYDDPQCPAPTFDQKNNTACRRCMSNDDPATCRPCDSTTVLRYQATHSQKVGLGTAWNLAWIAPPPGSGDVTVYLAGNAVNGNGTNDLGDLWNFLGASELDPVIVIPERPMP